jgi:hypothetical protein
MAKDMTAPVAPQPLSWTVAIIATTESAVPTLFGRYDTKEQATEFARGECQPNGLPFDRAGRDDVFRAVVVPI